MEKKEDLRLQKTFDALSDAFQELIQEKPFEKITVRELCSRAKTRTATFYSHFTDKYDFFVFMIHRLRQQNSDKNTFIVAESKPEEYISHYLHTTFDFLEQNEAFLRAIGTNNILAPTLYQLSNEMSSKIHQDFKTLEAKGYTLSAAPEIITELFIGAVSRITSWWICNKTAIEKDTLIENLLTILPKIIYK
ncbi:MAG: TetR/AcrR family transcriptional regulator [Lachnospiraceae bacterium]|nr:TetR/AcrR family transcriptional regulator [Lachnospiraceae bacterium]